MTVSGPSIFKAGDRIRLSPKGIEWLQDLDARLKMSDCYNLSKKWANMSGYAVPRQEGLGFAAQLDYSPDWLTRVDTQPELFELVFDCEYEWI